MANPALAQTDPPIPPAMLARLVLRWRRDAPTAGAGAHLRRHQGHSLEFREFRPWAIGDDIRKVDWRASARQGRRGELLLRSFEAEERMGLLIVIDNRREMMLPEAMPRLLYALWAARALTTLALEKGDDVHLARLFDGAGAPILSLRGAQAQARARSWSEAIWQPPTAANLTQEQDFADLSALGKVLRPSGAVVVISDMLFDDDQHRFARFAHEAQRQRRSLSILQLDSSRYETNMLRAERVFQLIRPRGGADELNQFEEQAFTQAAQAIQMHLDQSRKALQAGGLDWPRHPILWRDAPTETDLAALFRESFPRLALLRGLALGRRE